jgi:hypothetical protein
MEEAMNVWTAILISALTMAGFLVRVSAISKALFPVKAAG